MSRIRVRVACTALISAFSLAFLASLPPASAQVPARDENVALAYEGFWVNEDGSFDLLFGLLQSELGRGVRRAGGPG